jgi:hypothetical protein
VSAQALTYPQNSSVDKPAPGIGSGRGGQDGNSCQVIDSPVFFGNASILSDAWPGTVNQAFGAASTSFPTKLSTETVGDCKMSYGS